MRSKYFQMACVLLLAASVALAACGKSSSDGSGSAASLAMKGTSGNAVNMNGSWSDCTFNSTDHQNQREVVTFNGGSATFAASIWDAATNANCTQTAAPDALLNATVSVTLGSTGTAIWTNGISTVSPPAGIAVTAHATKATVVFSSFTLTPGSDLFAGYFNTSAFCGKTDWVKGVAKNVLNCTDMLFSTTETAYWVVDDSGAQLKWYSGDQGVAWQVDINDPMLK